ncbi:hypothetical protein FRB94_007858 [Tulasnella sp. JGI-2019a]|nr:hypothetical protein FRB93_007783 [Tulasnella sp. JGI-2019a]KAG8997125.1 hypothetical protein FRB94_007858 [Tulasnella sp. JGI-2019a]
MVLTHPSDHNLGAQASETRETVSTIHETTPHPSFVDNLSEDILSYIFRLVVAETSPEDIPLGRECYFFVDKAENDGEIPPLLPRAQLRFPEEVILVNRRWRNVGLGTALMWTRIIYDLKHPPERVARWLERSRQAPLSVHWAGHAVNLPLLLPHMHRIECLDLRIWPDDGDEIARRLLQPLASMSTLNGLSVSSVSNYRGVYLNLGFINVANAFNSLRHFMAYPCVTLPWSWPIRNLLSLELDGVDTSIEWPHIRDVLSASPNLQQLTLINLDIRNCPPPDDDNLMATLPVFYHFETIWISDLRYSCDHLRPRPSILQAIRAPAITNLVINQERNIRAALIALALGGSASLESLSIGLTGEPMLEDLITALTDSLTTRLDTLMISYRPSPAFHPYYHTISVSSMLALGKCTSLQSLKLSGVTFPHEALVAMVKERKRNTGSGLDELYTSSRIADVKEDLERLGVFVVDEVPYTAQEWDIGTW